MSALVTVAGPAMLVFLAVVYLRWGSRVPRVPGWVAAGVALLVAGVLAGDRDWAPAAAWGAFALILAWALCREIRGQGPPA